MRFLPSLKPVHSGPIRHAAVAIGATALLAMAAFAAAPSISGQSTDKPAPASAERRTRDLMVLAGRGSQIGVSIRDAESADRSGVVIDAVTPGSPADRAGIKKGDLVVEFDGEHVRSARQFSRLVQETPPGRSVKATLVRDGRRTDVQLTPDTRTADVLIDGDALQRRLTERLGDLQLEKRLGNLNLSERLGDLELDELARLPRDFAAEDDSSTRPRLGVTVQELTPQLAAYFGVKEGVLVSSVSDGSPAARGGLKAGDVIMMVNHEPIRTSEDLIGALRQTKTGESLVLRLVRDKKEIESRVSLPARD